MSIEFIVELEKLVQIDETTDENNAIFVDESLHNLNCQLNKMAYDIVQLGNQSIILQNVLKKILWIREQELELLNEKDQQDFDQAMYWLREYDVSAEYIVLEQDEIFEVLGMIESCSYIKPSLPTLIRKSGNKEISKVLREILTSLRKKELKCFIDLGETMKEMESLRDNLDRERRKFHVKLQKNVKKKLLTALHEEKREYTKDTIMLLEGLLEMEEINYYLIKTQLDEQYREFIQEKIIGLSKLVNMNEKMLIDKEKLGQTIQEYKKKSETLITSITKAQQKKEWNPN